MSLKLTMIGGKKKKKDHLITKITPYVFSKHCLCAALIPTQPAEEAPQRREFALQGCERAIANSLGEARPLVEGPGSG